MQTRYLRLVCRSRDIDYPMYLDAPVETSDGRSTIVGKAMMCGFMRKEGGDLHPFVLRKDKPDPDATHLLGHVVDFGTDYEDPNVRYFHTNLPSKRIHKAEQFTVRIFDDSLHEYVDNIYDIQEVIDLVRQQPVEDL
ncbi:MULTISPECIES: hypothetical protein [Rhizobium]|uniref:Uncharacterized protein n=1 Tax=Rhizobium leguminosarum bv. viciae TaxID=387 RepID=A0A8G2IQJ9_RHILV|nr:MULTISPECIES: hypothetical protein [Rhizobium]MCH4549425.1 hypothetical protein [Rhizobium changzhiense]NEI66268.1 hypothetical protein [Rhizobium leguminosarum]NKK11580.1 hypothetical protein [Rhizobium leguminosarum bv. viciae]NKK25563.1 hypothetical protein [Rhizobium leguminosarum bv. viciae]NKN03361.1 hypothetical protein [Rhizobium leguminosarum bv. viciae]